MDYKVGDKLAVVRHLRRGQATIITIERITPSGRLYCSRDYVLNPDLSIRGLSSSSWGTTRSAEPITKEIRESLYRAHVLRTIAAVDWSKLPVSTIDTILKQIEAGEKTQCD